jgi:4-hydroxythreonine-4-phosphate dehydrogenase
MKIAISFGDPNGIGFETFIKAVQLLPNDYLKRNQLYLFGNKELIASYLRLINFDYKLHSNSFEINGININIQEIEFCPEISFGKVSQLAGDFSYQSLKKSTEAVIKKEFDALVTLPVSKEALQLSGFEFPGQTEFLTQIDGRTDPFMLLFNKTMKVALATIHVPISNVPKLISKELIHSKIKKFNNILKNNFKINSPKIAVLGLNPHAGENGKIGTEENDIIIPAIADFRESDININGPFAADGFFGKHLYREFDCILAMYHDQGLIPMKMTSIDGGVNYTGGLSFVRTSPDHGTGFDIAGKNIAEPKSTFQAIIWAEKLKI